MSQKGTGSRVESAEIVVGSEKVQSGHGPLASLGKGEGEEGVEECHGSADVTDVSRSSLPTSKVHFGRGAAECLHKQLRPHAVVLHAAALLRAILNLTCRRPAPHTPSLVFVRRVLFVIC